MLDRVLVFTLAGHRMALPADAVRECLALPRLRRRPGLPAAVAGFFSFGKTILPVLDLARLLGLRAGPPPQGEDDLYRHLLRLGGGLGGGLGGVTLLVDRAVGFAEAAPAPDDPAPDPWQHGCVSRRVLVQDEPVMLLDPERILRRDERARLDALGLAERIRAEAWNGAGSVTARDAGG